MSDGDPLPAATILAVRDGPTGLEVLMVRRPDSGTFPGVYVFPGGKVDPEDGGPDARAAVVGVSDPCELRWRAAAIRELAEEVGLVISDRPLPPPPPPRSDLFRWVASVGGRLDAGRLHYLSTWVTPEGAPARFDTRFYLVQTDGTPVPARGEVEEACWVNPGEALARHARGEWPMILPTVKHLELIADHPTVDEVIASLPETRPGDPIQPRVVRRQGTIEVLMPGDPGYEEAG